MNGTGVLRICINVNWKGDMKRVTVYSKFCDRDDAMPIAREFMKQNPCVPQCLPEVTWSITETLELK